MFLKNLERGLQRPLTWHFAILKTSGVTWFQLSVQFGSTTVLYFMRLFF